MKSLVVVLLVLSQFCPSRASAQITNEDLLGTWRWVQTAGGFGGTTITPNDSLWVQLKFEPLGVLRGSLSGAPATGSYTLSGPGVSPQTLTIQLDGVPGGLPLPATTETFFVTIPFPGRLVLDEGCCDLWRHDFEFDPSGIVSVDRPNLGEIKSRWQP